MPTWAVIVGLCVTIVAGFFALVCIGAGALRRADEGDEGDDADF